MNAAPSLFLHLSTPTESVISVMEEEKKIEGAAETAYLETVKREGTDSDNLVADARAATEAEHRLTLRQGLKRYPKAVAWSLLISTCIIMTGFDVVFLGSFYGLPQFNKRYGVQLPDGTYTIKTGEFPLLLHFGAPASRTDPPRLRAQLGRPDSRTAARSVKLSA